MQLQIARRGSPCGTVHHTSIALEVIGPATSTTEAAVGDGSVGVVVAALRGRPPGQMRRRPQVAAWEAADFHRRTAPRA